MSKARRKLVIKNLNPDAFSLYSVVSNPRDVTPYDLQAACNNVSIESDGDKLPAPDVMSLVHYLLTDYFQLAHRTGLYNRQKDLWESIARINQIEIGLLKTGMLNMQSLPVYEIDCYTSNQQPAILARLVKPQKRSDFDRRCLNYLASFVKRITKLHSAKGTLKGCFICFPEPISQTVLSKAQEIAGGDDPVNKFEARLAEPVNIPLDVLVMDYNLQNSSSEQALDESNEDENGEVPEPAKRTLYPVRLAHPQLKDRRSKSGAIK